ncbi:dienelactone hydrolase family protein [Actinophytocola sp.]|uniref:dienelactone hydrolase family protein n=1 Tax=Actinophytocola sp. TaxID=1872138 RepID=UPI002D7F9760|nr:dienelactone hydrolase family protein [Actinophytocola sp.]HET9140826.1 dienelactone hydrolase family protein [Actinophytocola sp.]
MTEIQRYLAEEVAEDLADGIINRREAVRRLGLLGVTGAAASGLLATFAAGVAAAEPDSATERRGSAETSWAPVARESITFAGPRVPLLAAWAPAAKPRGGVLVIHENRGLNEHIRTVAGRFAASGYSALALDLLSEEGGTGAFPGEAEVAAALSRVPPARFDEDMRAAVTELRRRLRGKKLAAIGFCFGGAMIWRLLAAGEPRLAAAAPFYGPFPEGGNLGGSRADVLGVYGGLDARVNATRPAAKAALEAARLRHELLTFTEADHAFFNDTGARFNPHAATEAWRRVLNWFDAADDHRHRD